MLEQETFTRDERNTIMRRLHLRDEDFWKERHGEEIRRDFADDAEEAFDMWSDRLNHYREHLSKHPDSMTACDLESMIKAVSSLIRDQAETLRDTEYEYIIDEINNLVGEIEE